MAKKKDNDYGTGIPKHEMEAFARILLPKIQKFFESEDGKRVFEEWKSKQGKTLLGGGDKDKATP